MGRGGQEARQPTEPPASCVVSLLAPRSFQLGVRSPMPPDSVPDTKVAL